MTSSRKRRAAGLGPAGLAVAVVLGAGCRDTRASATTDPQRTATEERVLPAPGATATMSLEEALRQRRSRRDFAPGTLTAAQIGQLAWAAQGITDAALARRTAPSAGALYPLELYVVDAEAVWHYRPPGHRLQQVARGDHRAALARAAAGQPQVGTAAVALVLTGVVARTRAKYGDRAPRYVDLEAGHAAQNVLLEATALGLAAVPVGAFDDDQVRRVLGASRDETPLYILCVGRPASHAE